MGGGFPLLWWERGGSSLLPPPSPHPPQKREPTPHTGWARVRGGQSPISLEYQIQPPSHHIWYSSNWNDFPCSSITPTSVLSLALLAIILWCMLGWKVDMVRSPGSVKNQFLDSKLFPTFKMLTGLRMCSVSHTWIISGYVGHHPTTFLLLLLGWYHTQWKLSNCHRICGPLNFFPP